MRIREVESRSEGLVVALTALWEESVRATHLFLTEAEVLRIKEYVPQALAGVQRLAVAELEPGVPVAFMGTQDGCLEMLFVAPEQRGKGAGSLLLRHGIACHGVTQVTVNEQNPQAVGFYQHLGFETFERSETDDQGGPYPILRMKLKG